MVLILSDNANRSPQVRREVERALSKGLVILPCRVEDVRPVGAMEYALSNTHWLDVFTPPKEARLRQLADAVRVILTAGSERATPAAVVARQPGHAPERKRRNAARTWIAAGTVVLGLCLLAGLIVQQVAPRNQRETDHVHREDNPPAGPSPSVKTDQPPAAQKAPTEVKGTVTFKEGRARTFTSLTGVETSNDVSTQTPGQLVLIDCGPRGDNHTEIRIPLESLKRMTVGPNWVDIEPYRFMVALEVESRSGKKQAWPACIACIDVVWSDGIGTNRYLLHSGVDVFLGAKFAFDP